MIIAREIAEIIKDIIDLVAGLPEEENDEHKKDNFKSKKN